MTTGEVMKLEGMDRKGAMERWSDGARERGSEGARNENTKGEMPARMRVIVAKQRDR